MKILIRTEGGFVQQVDVPPGVEVEARDYDTDAVVNSDSEDVRTDDAGNEYVPFDVDVVEVEGGDMNKELDPVQRKIQGTADALREIAVGLKPAEATARPWRIDTETWEQDFGIVAGDGKQVAQAFADDHDDAQGRANAALIVRAVNNHDALVAVAEAVLETVDPDAWHDDTPTGPGHRLINQARAALRAAKGEA